MSRRRLLETVHRTLPPLALRGRSGGRDKYTGPHCPVCQTTGDDRFVVWIEDAAGAVPKGTYFCNQCRGSGRLEHLAREIDPQAFPTPTATRRRRGRRIIHDRAEPRAEHIAFYRELYELVMLWACGWLDDSNPDPLAFLASRGLAETDVRHHMIGYALNDSHSLLSFLAETRPDLMPYAEEAGLSVRTDSGALETHWNVRGVLVFPTIADGQVVDLRTRKPVAGANAKSLPGSPDARGATVLQGWDELGTADTVVLTESSEFKTLVPLAAYRRGALAYPVLGQPGLTHFRREWGQALYARGVRTVIIVYDTNVRNDGTLRVEERVSVQHGAALAAAGLAVRVARLPLAPGQTKTDMDSYLLQAGAAALGRFLDDAVPLADYFASLPRGLVRAANLAPPHPYPVQRGRLRLLSRAEAVALTAATTASSRSLADERDAMRLAVREHASDGAGFLVLAQPPGTGKGTATTYGLRDYERQHPNPGTIVWTAIRKDQFGDQDAALLDLVPLHGRNAGNCQRVGDTQTLARKGYNIRDGLCARRCVFAHRCQYLQQFHQEANFFAPLPLLQATGWWQEAGVVVLDEFDPARLTRTVQLAPPDITAMLSATNDVAAQAVLRWLSRVCGTTVDATLSGVLLLQALEAAAEQDGMALWPTVQAALAALPPEAREATIPGLPRTVTSLDLQTLPPSFLRPILAQLDHEGRKRLQALRWTSRLEVRDGQFYLFQLSTHLRDQLANAEQPKIVLDATVNVPLLQALFPATPITVQQPQLELQPRVIQHIGRDYAKSSLRGDARRRDRWYDTVAAQVRPGRKTLIVCTLQCETALRTALHMRGFADVVVAHYGNIRGSNAYKGYDVILAQVYHPNTQALVHEGRALFADDPALLDERLISVERPLTDDTGRAYMVPVVTFADERLAALHAMRREAEMVQAAYRGRPLDHPDAQITLMFSLPLPQLAPTVIVDAPPSAKSNAGRQAATLGCLLAAAQQRLSQGARLLDVAHLRDASGCSVVTIRKHLPYLANRLHLRLIERTRRCVMPRGGVRCYMRVVLIVRGRRPGVLPAPTLTVQATEGAAWCNAPASATMMDQAQNHDSLPRVIHHQRAFRRARAGGGAQPYQLPTRRTRICAHTLRGADADPPPAAYRTAQPDGTCGCNQPERCS